MSHLLNIRIGSKLFWIIYFDLKGLILTFYRSISIRSKKISASSKIASNDVKKKRKNKPKKKSNFVNND
jgi:hypothetical protein